jgi:glutamate decarboxylase
MLAGLVMRWHWRKKRQQAGLEWARPNVVMGANRQVCWDKFCAYFDVEPRFMPLAPGRLHLSAAEAVALSDEHTIGVVAVLGSVVDGSYEPIAEIAAALDGLEDRTGLSIPLHVDAASGGFVAPFNSPGLHWDFRLPRVQSINASGHKYGGVLPGVGWVLWRKDDCLPQELRFDVNYLGGITPTIGINFSRSGAQVVAQYYNFIHLGRRGFEKRMAALEAIACHLADGLAALPALRLVSHPRGQLPVFCVELEPALTGWNVFHLSDKLQERGWLVPAYTLPAAQTERAVLRFVVRAGFSRHLAEELLEDVRRAVEWLTSLDGPMPMEAKPSSLFHH